MTFIFKIIFSLFAIIVDKCGACNNDTAIRQSNLKSINQNNLYRNYYDNRTEIPLDLIQKYNDHLEVNGLEDFLHNFVDGWDEDGSNNNISSRLVEVEERSLAVAQAANCVPELTTIEIVHSDDPTIRYIPRCTRLEKCGGCCSDSRLSCEPTKVEIVSLQVTKFQIQSGNTTKLLGKEEWNAQRDITCKCQCKIKENECTSLQMYNKKTCSCICKNSNEENQCKRQTESKMWNPDTCKCECREIKECSTGYTYDTNQCSCTELLVGGAPHIPHERAYGLINEENLKIPFSK